MHYKKYVIVFLILLGLCKNIFAIDQEVFEKVNNILDTYIYSYQVQEVIQQDCFVPYLQFNVDDFKYGASLGSSLSFNTIYLNKNKKYLDIEQANYSNIQNFLFRYEKINGDFFALVSIVAENQFLEQHDDLDFDTKQRIYTNNLYKDMMINAIYGYSGIKISDEILYEYVELLKNSDFSDIVVQDIYLVGLEKKAELNLRMAKTYKSDKKDIYGYLPDFDMNLSYSGEYGQEYVSRVTSNIRISIPNLGFTSNLSYSNYGNEGTWSSSISISFPIEKRYIYEYSQSEYSFSSETFLVNLSGLLYSYNQLKDRTDTKSKYELLILKTRLLSSVKKYMELY